MQRFQLIKLDPVLYKGTSSIMVNGKNQTIENFQILSYNMLLKVILFENFYENFSRAPGMSCTRIKCSPLKKKFHLKH